MKLPTKPATIFSFSLLVLFLSSVQGCSIIQKFAPELLESEIPSSKAEETLKEVTDRQAKEYLAEGNFISSMSDKIECHIANTKIYNKGKEIVNVVSPKTCALRYRSIVSSLFVIKTGQNRKDFKLVKVICQKSSYEEITFKNGADGNAYYPSANSESENAAYRPRLINGFPSCPNISSHTSREEEVRPIYKDYSIAKQGRLGGDSILARIDKGTDRQAQEFSKFGKYIAPLPSDIRCANLVSELKDNGNTVMNYVSTPEHYLYEDKGCNSSYENGVEIDDYGLDIIGAVFAVRDEKNRVLNRSRIICHGKNLSYEHKFDHPRLVNGVPKCGLKEGWKVFKIQQYPPIPIP
jgi:hypothetical protein